MSIINKVCLLNAMVVSMVLYIIITMPYILDTFASDDDFGLNAFISQMNLDKPVDSNRMLRGFNYIDNYDYETPSLVWVRSDDDTNIDINNIVTNSIVTANSVAVDSVVTNSSIVVDSIVVDGVVTDSRVAVDGVVTDSIVTDNVTILYNVTIQYNVYDKKTIYVIDNNDRTTLWFMQL